METDYQILCWVYSRLVEVHGESELVDYMHALRRVIGGIDPDKRSNATGTNSLNELQVRLADPLIQAIAKKYGVSAQVL